MLTLRPGQVAQHPDNLRDASRDIAALAASIKEVGILAPLIVVPVDAIAGEWGDGVTHVAVDGNRRQRAAEQVGADLPCIVHNDITSARDTAVTMTVTGLARDGWTLAEEVHGVQTLLDLGLSQAAISRASGRKPAEVRAAKKAAALSPETAEHAASYELTLDQMALLADYEGNEEATAQLLDAAKNGRMHHAAALIERERKAEQARAAVVAELATQGIAVSDQAPGHYAAPFWLTALTDQDGQPLDDHDQCPGHAMHVTTDYSGDVKQLPCCTADPEEVGHRLRYSASLPSTGAGGPMTDEQKAQRRELIARNKEMLAAQDVRRAFVRSLIGGRKHTKTAAAWALARFVTRESTLVHRLADYEVDGVLADLLGQEHSAARVLRDAPADRHPMLLWATVCAVYEAGMPKDVWRRPASARAAVTAYLAHLVELGYPPCDTEARMIADSAPADDDHFAEDEYADDIQDLDDPTEQD